MNFQNWYTDYAEIYRLLDSTDGALTLQENQYIGQIACRLTRVSGSMVSAKLQQSDTVAKIQDYYVLVCALDADIQSGDEIHLRRGAAAAHYHGDSLYADIYHAGGVQNVYEPRGMVCNGIAHKEVSLTRNRRA